MASSYGRRCGRRRVEATRRFCASFAPTRLRTSCSSRLIFPLAFGSLTSSAASPIPASSARRGLFSKRCNNELTPPPPPALKPSDGKKTSNPPPPLSSLPLPPPYPPPCCLGTTFGTTTTQPTPPSTATSPPRFQPPPPSRLYAPTLARRRRPPLLLSRCRGVPQVLPPQQAPADCALKY
jgi:hypothetical protein